MPTAYVSPARVLQITPRERSALEALAVGTSPADLAASLGISPFECEALLAAVFQAMGAATTAEAVAAAGKRGLLASEMAARPDVGDVRAAKRR